MFFGCNKLEEIECINKFITNKVKSMESMFRECNRLKEIKGISKFVTKEVTNMSGMFRLCSELENLDLSNFDNSNVISMQSKSKV